MNSQGHPERPAAIDQALGRVLAEIHAGLQHGYFEYTISCEILGHERRELVLHAGKSYRFLIPKDECVVSAPMVIPANGTPARENDETRSIVGMTSTRQAQAPAGLALVVADGKRR